MPEEYFDIVGENNQLLGIKKLRSEAHRDGDWHRTVHIYFLDEDRRRYLVHLRSKNKDSNPDKWDTRFGGHLKSGETFDEAALGEVKDETGIEVSMNDLIEGDLYKRDHRDNREFTRVHYFIFKGDINDLKFNDGEVQKVKWLSKDEIEKALSEDGAHWAPKLKGFRAINDFLVSKCGVGNMKS